MKVIDGDTFKRAQEIASVLQDQFCLEIIKKMNSIAWRFVEKEKFPKFLKDYPVSTIESSFQKLEKAGAVEMSTYGYVLTDLGKKLLVIITYQKNLS